MKNLTLARRCAIIFCPVFFFLACKQDPNNKKELWAVVINFFSPDPGYYPGIKKFPFPDSLRFARLESIFANQDKLPVISDSSIIFYDNYRVNGEEVCCKKDTLEAFTDSIKGKKYLFAIGEYIALFQSDSNSFTSLRPRKNIVSIPLWGIKLNTPYPSENFRDEYEKFGAKLVKLDERFDEAIKQKWRDNDSISVETIQFNNSTDRIITALYKDMNEKEVKSIIDFARNNFPNFIYREAMQKDSDGKPLKVIRILFQGVSMSFTQVNTTEYSFMMTDYYETIKLIINNAETGYVFRDDVKIF
ncbi:MAG TPA: hypothetical protein VFU29_20075 [Chitinophagaceae bacterium]|nr:hypothetical protein [Chitinophagaceae bacterium]